jgi:vacuolar-type H+-ATPase subunit E/Vma4
MSFFEDLLKSEAVQKVITEVEKALFEQFFNALEKVVERTTTTEDNEALAAFLEEAAERVREKQPAT